MSSATMRQFWPINTFVETTYKYQNVNHDYNLRKNVTLYFHDKVLIWIHSDDRYNKFEKIYSKLSRTDGKKYIYYLLKYFVKKSKLNWYELRSNRNIIKDYLYKKIYETFKDELTE